jgi:hypothetical protein
MTPLTGRHPATCFYTPAPAQNHRADRYRRPRDGEGRLRQRLIADVRLECERLAGNGARVSNGKGE